MPSAGRWPPGRCWVCSGWPARWCRRGRPAPDGGAGPGRRQPVGRAVRRRARPDRLVPVANAVAGAWCSPRCARAAEATDRCPSTTRRSPAFRGPPRPPVPVPWRPIRSGASCRAGRCATRSLLTRAGWSARPCSPGPLRGPEEQAGVLLAVPGGGTWLVTGGHRHRVDPGTPRCEPRSGSPGASPRPASSRSGLGPARGAAAGQTGRARAGAPGRAGLRAGSVTCCVEPSAGARPRTRGARRGLQEVPPLRRTCWPRRPGTR